MITRSDTLAESASAPIPRNIAVPTVAASPVKDETINILLVDDEPKNLTVLETILADPGYRLIRAESADQALIALVVEEFALLVLDINMPGMSGFELAHMIKQRKKTAGVPIIFLTAYYSEDEHVLEGYGTGAVDYLHKPVNPTILRSKAAVFVELYRKTRESALANRALLAEVTERRRIQEQLLKLNDELEQRVEQRTAELVETNNSLRASEERFCLARNAAALGIHDEHLANGTSHWDQRVRELWGVGPDEAVGSEMFLAGLHPDDRAPERAAVQQALAPSGEGEYRAEYRVINRTDGSQRWIGATGKVFFEQGRPVRFVRTVQDVTERKHAEEERQRLATQLLHAQKLESLGVLAGGIAHDFNNLLTSILGYSDLALLELPGDSSPHGLIVEAVNGARRAAELTNQMLAYSGKGRFVVQPLNLSEVVESLSRLLQVSISKTCTLQYTLKSDLPAIEADAAQMRQIIMNLIINASEAVGSRSGVIAVTTGVMHCDRAYLCESYLDDNLPEGMYVFVEVIDTGTGMSEDTRGKIFDPFFTTKFQGRGLGLSAVLGIVRGHRGAIKVYSEVDKGTTFKVLFPVSSQAVPTIEERDSGTPAWRGQGTVLIVDDEESVRGLACRMMQGMGFTTLTAEDGHEGVEVFRREAGKIRLVLLDMTMPRMDGAEVFTELRRIDDRVLAILSSGYNEQTATNRFVGKGLAAFIQKPYRYEQLVEVVRRVLGEADA